MNVDNIKILRDHILANPEMFNMDIMRYDANSTEPTCVIGHAFRLWHRELPPKFCSIAEKLGVSFSTLWQIFLSHHTELPPETKYKDITAEMAVKLLDNLIETGEVDWRHATA